MKAFIASEIGYCPLLWMFHSRKLNSRINKFRERALKIVYQDYASSFRDDTHMTSRKIVQFSESPAPLVHLRPKFFYPLAHGRPV